MEIERIPQGIEEVLFRQSEWARKQWCTRQIGDRQVFPFKGKAKTCLTARLRLTGLLWIG